MTKLNSYLTFAGTAAEAIELYKKVFKVDPVYLQHFKEMPEDAVEQAGMKVDGAAGERILHAMFEIGDDQLMISDAPEDQDDTVVMGTQLHISVTSESKEEADRMFAGLSEGGNATMPMADAFWGDYFGMCTDRFGINWMIGCRQEK